MVNRLKWYLMAAFICTVNSASSHRFGYASADQKNWKRKHTQCSGVHQSPISVHSKRTIPMYLPSIEFVQYHNLLPGPLKIKNNGHSVSLEIPRPEVNSSHLPYIFGGKLPNEYELVGLHFHWGDKNNKGAEHVLNDIRYSLELHIIHKNRKYQTLEEALTHRDGLAVLGFFYQIKEYESPEITSIARNLAALEEHNNEQTLNYTFTLASLLGNLNTERFYTYRGSLTTPPCSEAVTWILFPDTLSISLTQIAKFRELSNDGLMLVNNFRNLQPVGNRNIFARHIHSRHSSLKEFDNRGYANESDWYNNN